MRTESAVPAAPGHATEADGRARVREATPPWAWAALGLVILAATAIRVRLLDVPLERDEGEYAYQGALILSGLPPYRFVYTQKLPGTHLVYAASMALFGRTIPGARAALVLATGATALGVFLLGRRFFGSVGALAAATAYAVLSLSTEMLGPFGHATHFVAFFAVWGLITLERALERGSSAGHVLAGVLFGLGILMKQHGAVFLACAAVWIAVIRPPSWLRYEGLVLLGAALPIGALVAWLLLSGSLPDFWYWVVSYGFSYGTLQTLREGWNNLVFTTSRFIPQAFVFWLLAAGGAGLLLLRRGAAKTRLRLGVLLGLSFLGVGAGLYFRDHYFLLLLPAIALLVGIAAGALEAMARGQRGLVAIVLLLACAQALWSQREIFFQASPDRVSRLLYGPDLFPESIEIGRYLRGHTKSGDTIVVFGSEPQIPFYARRRSATGFVFVYPLMQPHRDARQLQEKMVREVAGARPAYAVLVKVPTSWLEQWDSDHFIQDWATKYINEHYALAGQVLVTDRGSRYLWDEAALRSPIGEATQAIVMRRRDFAPAR